MKDIYRQLAVTAFGSILTALLSYGALSLGKISDTISSLDVKLAVVVTEIANHEHRIEMLEHHRIQK